MRLLKWVFGGFLIVVLITSVGCGALQRTLTPVTETVLSDSVIRIPAGKNDKFIVLTIDDGPSPRTPELLAILKKHDVKATFFIHTNQIAEDGGEASMAAIIADGHELAYHMPKDMRYGGQRKDVIEAEFAKGVAALKPYKRSAHAYFRPPRGSYNSRKMDPVLKKYGYHQPFAALGSDRRYILASFIPWDASKGKTDTPDAERNLKNARRYADQVASSLYPGAIVIFHDGIYPGRETRFDSTLYSLDRFLTALKETAYDIVPLSVAINRVSPQE